MRNPLVIIFFSLPKIGRNLNPTLPLNGWLTLTSTPGGQQRRGDSRGPSPPAAAPWASCAGGGTSCRWARSSLPPSPSPCAAPPPPPRRAPASAQSPSDPARTAGLPHSRWEVNRSSYSWWRKYNYCNITIANSDSDPDGSGFFRRSGSVH